MFKTTSILLGISVIAAIVFIVFNLRHDFRMFEKVANAKTEAEVSEACVEGYSTTIVQRVPVKCFKYLIQQ